MILAVRLVCTVLAYSEAVGVTEGSIIAAIISVHTATNTARPSPIVPVIPVIPRARATVAAQAASGHDQQQRGLTGAQARPGPGQLRRAVHPDHENGAEKPLCPSRPQSIPNVERCAASAGATVSVVFDGWNTFVSCTGS